jgi:2-dehydro-3-deoxyphosphooctonate aldolase (KDO 8-P synthase)
MKSVSAGEIKIGDAHPLVLVAGLCIIQDEGHTVMIAERLLEITSSLTIPFIFKASYDKANRSSLRSYRGPGVEKGLEILENVKQRLGLTLLTDVHRHEEIEQAAGVVDVLQIPAFLCRQTDFVVAVARTGKPVNAKKGQFMAPWDMKNVIEKITSTGNDQILLTERGTTFGYNNLVSDLRSLSIMRTFGYPVVYDATHSVQLPGGAGTASSGQREFVAPLARAATAAGIDALFLEVHENPDQALSDGPNTIALDRLPALLSQIKAIDACVKGDARK